MEKPKLLYHASIDKNILEFEPRNETPRYDGEVDLVFATPDPSVAAMFLVPRGVATEIAVYGDKHVVFVNSSQADYELADRGGAIYKLPADTFKTTSLYGMGEVEWVSEVSVRPISKEEFNTSIKAMNKYGIIRYFVSDEIFKEIQQNPANALELVR